MNFILNQIKKISALLAVLCIGMSLAACGKQPEVQETADIGLEDGVYLADFNTDSTMFHVNETLDGKGILTVSEGKATIHIVLASKGIVGLYEGLAENVKDADVLSPTVETVNYPDGTTDEANAFDVSVPYLDEEFDLAIIGKKDKWYDHKVSVSNPQPYVEQSDAADKTSTDEKASDKTAADTTSDGKQAAVTMDESIQKEVEVVLTGGSGKTKVESPAKVSLTSDGQQMVTIIFSSKNYDYMIVNGEKYLPINTEGNSTFEIPLCDVPGSMTVIADTVAMSTPHEVEYTLEFSTVVK